MVARKVLSRTRENHRDRNVRGINSLFGIYSVDNKYWLKMPVHILVKNVALVLILPSPSCTLLSVSPLFSDLSGTMTLYCTPTIAKHQHQFPPGIA